MKSHLLFLLLASCFQLTTPQAIAQPPASPSPIALGSRIEMFVDHWLLDSNRSRGVSLQLQTPVRREVVLTTDKPWEGKDSAYFTVFQDGPLFRLYYRGFIPRGGDASTNQITCYAESRDGINFTRPNLSLYDFQGSKENNIIHTGRESHNFAPFLDANPQAKPAERYKAVGGIGSRLFGFVSADGIHWRKIQPEPVMTKSEFDSLNIVFWDGSAKVYRCYSRYWTEHGYRGIRSVQSSQSDDFVHWQSPTPNRYLAPDGATPPPEHFYTSGTTQCPGAPHHYLAFPMRFLPDRTKPSPLKQPGASDAVFLSSRNGVDWDRSFLEAWSRPGLDERNWTHRSNMPASGIVQTSSNEFSLYISEHYDWPDNRLRRLTVRRHGFASLHAGREVGEFTTKPLTFSGKNLILNYSTSAAGSVRVELRDDQDKPLPGYTLDDNDLLFGDDLDAVVKWKSGNDLSPLLGKTVRLRFLLKDADLFSLRFQ
jgi:hypothetical protein